MSDESGHLFDVFISYAPSDREWVDEWLLPRLEQAGLRVAVDYRDFILGTPRLENIERAVQSSHRTLVVLTPAWLESEWNAFEALLVRTIDPAARQRKLLPVLVQSCELPELIASLEKADLTVERHWEKELRRLTRDIQDVIPVPAPWREGKVRDFTQWKRWIRRYRRRLGWGAVAILLLWLVVFGALELPPFQPREVWVAELLRAPNAEVLHNSGTLLAVGGANIQEGCNHPHKGLWYRWLSPNNAWAESDVGNLLCIEDRDPPALSDIVALASLPDQPDTIYALTSHSGLLISADAGAHFRPHAADFPAFEADNAPVILAVSGKPTPVFWVTGEKRGLWVFRDDQWSRLDGQGNNGCATLPGLTVTSLLVTDDMVLIGTDRRGLWASDDGGHTCRQVFDPGGRYQFFGLWDVSPDTHARYLALVLDWGVEPRGDLGTWQLLDLCPRPTSCDHADWQREPNPVWHKSTVVQSVLVQPATNGDYEWYLVSEFGQIWRGNMQGGEPERLPGINRCFIFLCFADLAPASPGEAPYLLANERVYQYAVGNWWQRYWP